MGIQCLVELSWGLGDIVQATPLCHALWLVGLDVDLFINSAALAPRLAPLFEGHPAVGRVLTDVRDVDFATYDCAVSAFGDRLALHRVAPGRCRDVGFRDVVRDGLGPANLAPARDLGYDGPTPPSIARAGGPAPIVPAGSVVVHAGCDPIDLVKRWSGWPEICARLAASGRHVIVIGTEADRSDARWEDRYDVRFGRPLPEVIATLERADAYLGNDSGVGHLAAAAGTPGVLVFGPTDPDKYAPNSGVLRAVVAPARAGESRLPGFARRVPIDRVTVDAVWNALAPILADPRRDPPRPLPARRTTGRPDPFARLPTPSEIARVPARLEDTDALLNSLWAGAVRGLLMRDGDRRALADWRRAISLAAGLANLRAAEARRRDRTWKSHRKALRNIYLAWRAGCHLRSVAAAASLVATPRSRGAQWDDRLRD